MTIENFLDDELIGDYSEREKDSENIITESDLKSFFKCPHSYHLKHNIGFSNISKSGFAALAMFFENARRSLYYIRDKKVGKIFPGQIRAGRDLKLAEEMNVEELREYLAYGEYAFGNLLFGRWNMIVKEGEYVGSELSWGFKSQGFNGGKQLQKAGNNYYQFVLENGAPILGFINKETSFEFQGFKIKIKFPELRKGGVIDDVGLWGFNSIDPDGEESNLDNSILVTLRVLGYCTLASKHDFYRRKWRIPDEIVEELEEKQIHISDKIRYRYFNATENKIIETTRDDSHLDLLRRGLDMFLEAKEKENFPVDHSSCNSCGYNVVDLKGKVVCRERKTTSKPSVPAYYFKKTAFEIKMHEEEGKITLEGLVRKNKDITKPVNKFVLEYNEEGKVNSFYESEVRGLGFEDRMLMYADQRLMALSERSSRKLIHTIDFERNFKGSGQEKVKIMLKDLGYDGNPKNGYVKEYVSS